ncbi:MAG: NTF2-like N-terminal transpeptidase domain-containing protein, partial [Chloroflexota bacterium]
MIQRLFLFLFVITTACSASVLPMSPDDDFSATEPSMAATLELQYFPTQVPETVEEDAGGYARAFYTAWENEDYLGMYSLLSPQSQAIVDSDSFIARYDEAMMTAGVQSLHAQPLSLVQNGDRATFGVRVTCETAVVGPIERDFTVPLVYDDGRWGINWNEGLILPELD